MHQATGPVWTWAKEEKNVYIALCLPRPSSWHKASPCHSLSEKRTRSPWFGFGLGPGSAHSPETPWHVLGARSMLCSEEKALLGSLRMGKGSWPPGSRGWKLGTWAPTPTRQEGGGGTGDGVREGSHLCEAAPRKTSQAQSSGSFWVPEPVHVPRGDAPQVHGDRPPLSGPFQSSPHVPLHLAVHLYLPSLPL